MGDRGGYSDRDSKRPRYDDRDRGRDRYDDRDRGRDRREHEHEKPRERGDRRDRYDERDRRDRPHDDRMRERERARERERDRPPPERERPPREYGDRGRGRADREPEHRPAPTRPAGRGSGADARGPPAPAAGSEKQPSIMSTQELAELEERKRREEADYKKRVEEQVELMEMDDEEREQKLIEERRRRRAEIAAKFKAQPPSACAAADAAAPTAVPAPEKHKVESSASAAASAGNGSAPGPPNGGGAAAGPYAEPSALATPPAGDETAPQTELAEQADGAESESEEGEAPAASRVLSSDLSLEDRKKETELRAFMLAHRRQTEGGQPRRERVAPAAATAASSSAGTSQKAGAEEEGDVGFDMFNDDVEEVTNPELMLDEAAAMDRGDNYDDKEGYYAHRVGDVLGERYKVLGSFGKGVFSTVVKCEDLRAAPGEPTVVAIKVQRNNEMMRRAGEKEIATLVRLRDADPENRKHCIRLLGRFDHEDHLCMVFEALHQNLRMAVKQFGHRRGIQIDAVRTYARQLFVALRHMEKLGIVHADLKPDNVVVNDRYNVLKVCDFGSAIDADDQEITPYMVSRFYRAPEIMMGLHFSCPIDMWAAATSLYELYTGKIMFAGHSNNQMLKVIMEVKGKMPHKLIRKGVFSELHFDPDYDFLYKEKDRVTGRDVIRLIKFEQRPMPGHDLKTLLTGGAKLTEAENRKVMMLADLLDKATTLDPAKRITPSQALRHPFCDLSRK